MGEMTQRKRGLAEVKPRSTIVCVSVSEREKENDREHWRAVLLNAWL